MTSDRAVSDHLLTMIACGITAHIAFTTEPGPRPYATTATRLRALADAATALADDLDAEADR